MERELWADRAPTATDTETQTGQRSPGLFLEERIEQGKKNSEFA